jgi:hypothetical protein
MPELDPYYRDTLVSRALDPTVGRPNRVKVVAQNSNQQNAKKSRDDVGDGS